MLETIRDEGVINIPYKLTGTALVTGASRGIGKATALAIAALGARVVTS